MRDGRRKQRPGWLLAHLDECSNAHSVHRLVSSRNCATQNATCTQNATVSDPYRRGRVPLCGECISTVEVWTAQLPLHWPHDNKSALKSKPVISICLPVLCLYEKDLIKADKTMFPVILLSVVLKAEEQELPVESR